MHAPNHWIIALFTSVAMTTFGCGGAPRSASQTQATLDQQTTSAGQTLKTVFGLIPNWQKDAAGHSRVASVEYVLCTVTNDQGIDRIPDPRDPSRCINPFVDAQGRPVVLAAASDAEAIRAELVRDRVGNALIQRVLGSIGVGGTAGVFMYTVVGAAGALAAGPLVVIGALSVATGGVFYAADTLIFHPNGQLTTVEATLPEVSTGSLYAPTHVGVRNTDLIFALQKAAQLQLSPALAPFLQTLGYQAH